MTHKRYFETEGEDLRNPGSSLTLAVNALSTSPMYSELIFFTRSSPLTFDVKNWFPK